jgi:hypothetical protein
MDNAQSDGVLDRLEQLCRAAKTTDVSLLRCILTESIVGISDVDSSNDHWFRWTEENLIW